MYSATRAVVIVTAYLIVYVILFEIKAPEPLLLWLFLCSPFLVLWMVYQVLKEKGFKYPALSQQEDWGYLDMPKETIYAKTCYQYMEPFQIEINIADTPRTLLVYHLSKEEKYDVFEDRYRLGIIYRDKANGGIWCSKDPIPMELVNLIGEGIDAYED